MRQGVRSAGLLILVCVTCLCTPVAAFALPEGRHYEMTSPPYKGGYGVSGLPRTIEAVAPDGEAVAFGSIGAFAGAPADHLFNAYLARRDPVSGWRSVSLDTPAASWPLAYDGVLDFSSNLGCSLTFGKPGPNRGWAEFDSMENEFLLYCPATSEHFEVGGTVLVPANVAINYAGGSADLSHLIVYPLPILPLVPEAVGATTALYDLVTRGGGEHPLRLIGLNNEIKPKPIAPNCKINELGAQLGKESKFGALAADGTEIFFTTCSGSSSSDQIFVRLDGARTLEVSRPFEAGPFGGCGGGGKPGEVPGEVPCQGAAVRAGSEFVGASEDGSRVFFTTVAQLEPTKDKDSGNDLYMATIGCLAVELECPMSRREVTSLTQVSHDPNTATTSEAADVQGVVAVSPDGSHVYFVARGVLSEGSNAEGHGPLEGADNLYVYERDERYPAGHVAFITDLCSGSGLSGAVVASSCPTHLGEGEFVNDRSLWMRAGPEAQTTGTGRFLVFSSYGHLLPNDVDNAKDVYRYDANTGVLDRVSVGKNGYGANGNCPTATKGEICDATIEGRALGSLERVQTAMESRAVSEDGSRVIFMTAEPLSPNAVNGLENAYEWHKEPAWSEGEVSLVSSGSDEQPVNDVVITPAGGDVFFATVAGLLPQDTDGAADVYDARLGIGFPMTPAQRQPCSGDACQGPLTNPAPLLVPGSVSQSSGENFAPPVKARSKKVKKRKGKTRRARARHSARIGSRGVRR